MHFGKNNFAQRAGWAERSAAQCRRLQIMPGFAGSARSTKIPHSRMAFCQAEREFKLNAGAETRSPDQ
jgi:hypothetical protein